jgi:hypothetical protein
MKNEVEEKNKEVANRAVLDQRRVQVWRKLKDYQDIKLLHESINYSRNAISNAINKGIGSIALLEKIDSYFKTREEAINNAKNNGTGSVGN